MPVCTLAATSVRMARSGRSELTACYDCEGRVAFTAAACPHCGSTQPQGPYVHNARERRLFDIERQNDWRLVKMTIGCCALGVSYGVIMAPGPWRATIDGLGYGFVGLMIGVPAAFIVNFSKRWFG